MTVETEPWDPAERLDAPEARQAYLEAAIEDGDPALIVAVIGDIARARGMSEVASRADVSREVMYKSFRLDSNPTIKTLSRVAKALGYRVTLERAEDRESEAAASRAPGSREAAQPAMPPQAPFDLGA